jgi:AbrB family looped-hinge helix DNA binding protein
MAVATITSKGQITIPSDVRKALSIGTGDRVEFVSLEPGKFLFVAAKRPVTELKGLFGKPKKAVTVEEMNAAIAAKASGSK